MARTNFPKPKDPASNPKGAGAKGGYLPWMADDARELIGKLGARNSDLATYFNVHDKTIEYWIRTKLDFNRAVKKGRLEASLKVSQALFQSAIGYSHKDTQMFMQQKTGKVKKVEYMKHYPPNVTAAKTYLGIMMRDVWAENIKVDVNHSGTIGSRIEDIPIHELPKDQQELLFSINMKQLSGIQRN